MASGRVSVLVAVLVVAACSASTGDGPFPSGSISVGDQDLKVWLADEPGERRQGLREVEALPGDVDGMLFSWPEPTSVSFGMRDTLIPLDIWWFDGDGVLIGSAGMDPCPAEPCTNYGSPGPVGWALETPAGAFDFPLGSVLSTTGND